MTEQAAYFAALNDGFSKEPGEYWSAAEAEISPYSNRYSATTSAACLTQLPDRESSAAAVISTS